MASLLLIDYLERSRAYYTLIQHDCAYKTEDTAKSLRVPLRQFAKVVMVRVDGELAMMVVPCHFRVELESLRECLGAHKVELAAEQQFQRRFPRCEVGAMPPFGHLFGLRAFMMPLFDEFADIHFKAGNHGELLRMPFSEFRRLAHAELVQAGAVQKRRRGPHTARVQRLLELAVSKRPRVPRNRHLPALAPG